jgi:hypothetical protein
MNIGLQQFEESVMSMLTDDQEMVILTIVKYMNLDMTSAYHRKD